MLYYYLYMLRTRDFFLTVIGCVVAVSALLFVLPETSTTNTNTEPTAFSYPESTQSYVVIPHEEAVSEEARETFIQKVREEYARTEGKGIPTTAPTLQHIGGDISDDDMPPF